MKDRTFWWGASLAFLPALTGAVGVSYSGMAAVNAVWRHMFDHDSPGLLMVVGGIGYGLTIGLLMPLFVFGAAARMIWPVTATRTATGPSSLRRVVEWIGLQILTLPISLGLTFAAYGLPWMFLGAR